MALGSLAYFLVVALCLLGTPLSAQSSVLEAELRGAVRILSRDVHTYHYTSRTRMGLPTSAYVAPGDAALVPFLHHKIERFWDSEAPIRSLPGKRGNYLASGLYVGPDPVKSRGFGGAGDSWVGVRILLRRGFRFVDARGWAWSPAARQQALAAGCEADTPQYLLLTAESADCRALSLELLRELGVQGILYSFARVAFTACDEPAEASFVLLDPALINPDTSVLFTAVARDDSLTAERSRIQGLYHRARMAGESRRSVPWPEFVKRPAEDEMSSWLRQHLFGCGSFAEDRLAVETAPNLP